MGSDFNELKDQIEELMPNREAVRFFIWDNFEGPLDKELHDFVVSLVEEYGSWKTKTREGVLVFQGWIYKQRKQGLWIYNYRNGKPHKKCYYKNNLLNGRCSFWDVKGNLEVVDYYKDKKHGEWLRYDSSGQFRQKRQYEHGRYKW